MSTALILPGLDGLAPVASLPRDGCCPPALCQLDPCSMICNFISALPSGPLWDRPKAEAMARYAAGTWPDVCAIDPDATYCPTMVDHAIYTATGLIDAIFGALAPAMHEAAPHSAYSTLDQWLERYGWRDCYDCACRDTEQVPSPIEKILPNGEAACITLNYPAELLLAVKRGIVIALHRVALRPRRNLATLNWVLEPLAARLEPYCFRNLALDPTLCNNDDGLTLCYPPEPEYPCEEPSPDVWYCPIETEECPGHDTAGKRCYPVMRQFEYCLAPTGDFMPKAILRDCFDPAIREILAQPYSTTDGTQFQADIVQAYYDIDLNGDERRLWPGVMAAECVARALLPRGAKVKLRLCT